MSGGERGILLLSGDRALAVAGGGPLLETLRGLREHLPPDLALAALTVAPGSAPQVLGDTRDPRLHVVAVPGRGRERVEALVAEGRKVLQSATEEGWLVVSHAYGRATAVRAGARLRRERGVRAWVVELHHLPGVPYTSGPRSVLERWLLADALRGTCELWDALRVVEPHHLPQRLARWRFPLEKVHCVPAVYLDRETFRLEAGPPAERPIDLAFVGRATVEKGARFLAAVLTGLARGRRWRFAHVGPLQGRFAARITRAAPHVHLECLPFQRDAAHVAHTLRASRLLLVPSYAEGGPRVVPEALACGTPVVAADVGRVREWLRDDVAGRILPHDRDAWIAEIERRIPGGETGPAVVAAAEEALAACDRRHTLPVYARWLASFLPHGERAVIAP